jgi:hypothetical protein
MPITQLIANHEFPLPADEQAPLRLPRRWPRRARAPGRWLDGDPSGRPEPAPLWIAGAAGRASAAIEAEFHPRG